MENGRLNKIVLHFGLAIVLAIIIHLLTALTGLIPDIGYGILTFIYIFIITGLIIYYHLTTYFNIGLTILNFVLNFILWVAEQVNIESTYHDTAFYQNGDFHILVVILGGLLWATNKILIDGIIMLFKVTRRSENRLENYFSIKESTNR
jgi:hypothetical protein